MSLLSAGAITLTNGFDDGDVEVNVSEFGTLFSAYFDPRGDIGRGSTVYNSYVASTLGSGLAALDHQQDTGATILSQSSTQLVTPFRVNQLEFTLTQTVSDALSGGQQTGSILTQQFQIQNLTDVTNTFDLYRYMDGDLYLTDDSLDDGGGVIQQGGVTVLYETDVIGGGTDVAAMSSDFTTLDTGTTATDTFLGITAEGGTIPTTGRYSISQCCGIQLPGGTLDDDVHNDFDDDGIVDEAFDVTMTLRNMFSIGAGQTATYTTATLFGNGEPPAPGSTESLAILPDRIENVGDGELASFFFDIPAQDIEIGQPIWSSRSGTPTKWPAPSSIPSPRRRFPPFRMRMASIRSTTTVIR